MVGGGKKVGATNIFSVLRVRRAGGGGSMKRNSELGDLELPIPHKTKHPYRIKTFLIL